MRQLITHSTSTIMLIGGRTNLLGTCDCQTDPIGWDCLWSGRGIWGSSTTSSRPERLRHHPILLHQLSGPRGYTHFPQLHLDATLNAGDVPIAPTSSLWRGVGCIQGKRPTAVFYTVHLSFIFNGLRRLQPPHHPRPPTQESSSSSDPVSICDRSLSWVVSSSVEWPRSRKKV